MRFLFMSDTHFTSRKDTGQSIWLNRLLFDKWDEMQARVISRIKELKPDAIIHCGDFTQFGTTEDYAYGKAILDATGVPWYTVPGNHDASSATVKDEMRKEFGINNGSAFCYSRTFNNITVAFLDVCVRISDILFCIDEDALFWIEGFLKENYNKIVFLVCHIPVRYRTVVSECGKFITGDNLIDGRIYSRHIVGNVGRIENVSKLREIIENNKNVKIVFSGHWHINSLDIIKGVYYKIVPSVCDFPCEVVVVDCDAKEIKIHNKVAVSPELQKTSFIAEWNNTWVLGSRKSRNIAISLQKSLW